MQRATRWSDDDRNWGPFTWAYSPTYAHVAMVLKADVHEDGDCGTASLRITLGRYTLIVSLPQIIKPHLRRVYPEWDQATVARLGRNYYDLASERAYGASYSEGFLQVYRGLRTHDSSTDRTWGYFLPWTQWRQVAHRIYNADGSLVADVVPAEAKLGSRWHEVWRDIKDRATKAHFAIIDFDGERIEVETYAEEREWRLGTGWFRWLGYIAPVKRRRSLDMSFKKEVGPEKGSWKGGMMGTGIEMLPGETHEQAFRRFCYEEHRSKHRRYRVTFAESSTLTEGMLS
jgi:hypothetical protein